MPISLTRSTWLVAASLLAAPLILASSRPAAAQIGLSVMIAPPELQVDIQPPIPAEGYLWTPGYWAYNDGAYAWVPGAWEEPPGVGQLWTPPYWGWGNGGYLFHAGYWGANVGYYGGVNYGFGYGGNGYEGGRWDHGHFAYNRSVNNFGGVHIANVYDRHVTVLHRSRVSFVGGAHGLPGGARVGVHTGVNVHVGVNVNDRAHLNAPGHDFARPAEHGPMERRPMEHSMTARPVEHDTAARPMEHGMMSEHHAPAEAHAMPAAHAAPTEHHPAPPASHGGGGGGHDKPKR